MTAPKGTFINSQVSTALSQEISRTLHVAALSPFQMKVNFTIHLGIKTTEY